MAALAAAGGVYSLVLLAYALYSLYAFHHLGEFGYSTDVSNRMLRTYVACTAIILLVTALVVMAGLGGW